MAALFDPPDFPQESAETRQLRENEARRAEDDRVRSIQSQLSGESVRRNRGFGLRGLLGPLGTGGGLKSLLGSG